MASVSSVEHSDTSGDYLLCLWSVAYLRYCVRLLCPFYWLYAISTRFCDMVLVVVLPFLLFLRCSRLASHPLDRYLPSCLQCQRVGSCSPQCLNAVALGSMLRWQPCGCTFCSVLYSCTSITTLCSIFFSFLRQGSGRLLPRTCHFVVCDESIRVKKGTLKLHVDKSIKSSRYVEFRACRTDRFLLRPTPSLRDTTRHATARHGTSLKQGEWTVDEERALIDKHQELGQKVRLSRTYCLYGGVLHSMKTLPRAFFPCATRTSHTHTNTHCAYGSTTCVLAVLFLLKICGQARLRCAPKRPRDPFLFIFFCTLGMCTPCCVPLVCI